MLPGLRKALAICLFAALLPSGMPGVSDILCVSPSSGHQEVEGWSPVCCLPGTGDETFSAQSECGGCTDYSLLLTADLKTAQSAAWRTASAGDLVVPAASFPIGGWDPLSASASAPALAAPLESHLAATSLRC